MIVENRSWKISVLLHFALFLVAAFGLPVLLPDLEEPQPMVMTVDILPISAMTNVKPSDKPIQEKKAPAKPLPKPKEEVKPPPKPVEKEVKEEKFDPDEEAEVVEKKKPEEKKEKKKEKSFEEMMADLKKEANKTEEKSDDNTAQAENKTTSEAPYDESQPLSLSEEDAIKNAFIPCWSPPAGAKDAASLVVRIRVKYNATGTLVSAELDPRLKGRYNSDAFFRAAADAGMRAVNHPTCNPLKNLPAALYPKLKDRFIVFDPRTMMQ